VFFFIRYLFIINSWWFSKYRVSRVPFARVTRAIRTRCRTSCACVVCAVARVVSRVIHMLFRALQRANSYAVRALSRALFRLSVACCLRVAIVHSCVRAACLVRAMSRAIPHVVACWLARHSRSSRALFRVSSACYVARVHASFARCRAVLRVTCFVSLR
jgi:hypothetical protein